MMSSSLMPCSAGEAAEQEEASNSNNKMPLPPLSSSPPMLLLPHHLLHHISSATPLLPSDQLHDGREMSSSMPESWSQLLLGGLVGDHERYNAATALLSKGLEEEGHVPAAYHNVYGHGEEIQTSSGTNRSQVSQMFLASSPRSCITTSLGSNMLDFSNNTVPAPADQLKNHHSDNSSEGNSTASGSAPKKARVQTSSSAQSTLKVRKERLGDRITALHQIVSPFGKTDTASVLQETIGYIRFLLNQIEALSFPYLNNGNDSDSMQQQHNLLINNHSTASNNGIGMLQVHAQGSRTTTTDEQDGGGGDEAAGNNKDLRSRGLCLVPVSYCTSHLAADDNAAASDFWAVAPAPPRPPQQQLGLGGIIWG